MTSIEDMIATNDFSLITHDFVVTYIDFSILTNCKIDEKYSLYHISKEGVYARDVGDLAPCTPEEAANVYRFNEAAKLDFPTTAAHLVQWVENQNGEFSLPENFEIALTDAIQLIRNTKYPESRQRFQENEILRILKELKYIAAALPKSKPGVAGVKSEVRAKLDFSPGVFDKAWERLRASNEIIYK